MRVFVWHYQKTRCPHSDQLLGKMLVVQGSVGWMEIIRLINGKVKFEFISFWLLLTSKFICGILISSHIWSPIWGNAIIKRDRQGQNCNFFRFSSYRKNINWPCITWAFKWLTNFLHHILKYFPAISFYSDQGATLKQQIQHNKRQYITSKKHG